MLIVKDQIKDFLPQKDPFVMVDQLVEASENGFKTTFEVSPTNVLVDNGIFTYAGLLENIAQTCACGFAYLDRKDNSEPKLGFIGGFSKVEIHEEPEVNAVITTEAEVTHQIGSVFLIKGRNYSPSGNILLECEMKIAVQ